MYFYRIGITVRRIWLHVKFGWLLIVSLKRCHTFWRAYIDALQVIALARVKSTPELEQYAELLLDRHWDEWSEHLEWLATGDVKDIVDWAAGINSLVV